MCHFSPNFSWVGEFVGFMLILMCFPTPHNLVNRKRPPDFQCYCTSQYEILKCCQHWKHEQYEQPKCESSKYEQCRKVQAVFQSIEPQNTSSMCSREYPQCQSPKCCEYGQYSQYGGPKILRVLAVFAVYNPEALSLLEVPPVFFGRNASL